MKAIITFFIVFAMHIVSLGAADKEAMWYHKLDNKRVECELCPFQCVLKPGQRGQCGVRINKDGMLYTQVYGQIAAQNVDPIEKKPLFHFLPGSRSFSVATAGCNLHCKFCQNWNLSQSKPDDVTSVYMPPASIVQAAEREKCETIAYTYSEPIIYYELVLDTARKAKQAGIYNVLVTAGYINEEPLRRLIPYIDAAHLDLKGFSEEYYQDMTSGTLAEVLRTLSILKQSGVWVEIINLVVPTKNDDPELIEKMCVWIRDTLGSDTPVHFSRFYPMYKLKDIPPTPVATLERARDIARKVGLKYVYIGNVPGHPGEYTYCPKCGKVLIERAGYSIRTNHIVKGRCGYCGEPIAGKWK